MTPDVTPAPFATQPRFAAPLLIDTASVAADPGEQRSTRFVEMPEHQWERLSGQRDVMIRAMTRIFTFLNGGVFAFVVVAWAAGLLDPSYRIVDRATVVTLIGATVVQSGIAFIAITRFLFPSGDAAR